MFLLVGGDSEIGAATFRAAKARGIAMASTTRRPDRVAPDRPLLDLAAPLDAFEPPEGTTAACICAAVARLAACAADPAGTERINVTQTLALVQKLLAREIAVLFLSSNQIFDGLEPQMQADAPYRPVNEYGRQKSLTETALLELYGLGEPIAILRISKVVSLNLPLIHDWVAAIKAGKPIRAFHDMALAPVPVDRVCAAILALMEDRARGIFQLTGPSDVSYAEVARYLVKKLGDDPGLVTETSAREGGLPDGIARPHTTLDSSRLKEVYGIMAPEPWTVIEQVMATAK
jgi:dTDP-4-dehydrorhamnose reductase